MSQFETARFKQTRKAVKEGDMFAIKFINPDLYFYGRVIVPKTKYNIDFYSELDYVHLYTNFSSEPKMPERDDLKFFKCLLLMRRGWNSGVYMRIGNIPVDEKDWAIDCGFESIDHGGWVTSKDVPNMEKNHKFTFVEDGRIIASAYTNHNGELLDHIPQSISELMYYTIYSPATYLTEYIKENMDIFEKYFK